MKIFFDLSFDQGYWPGPLADKAAVAGELWTGPLGFLNVIETFTGLNGPGEPQTLRVAALVPSIRSSSGFWSRSAEVDPFGTARKVLEWRDYLWLHGWRGQKAGKRLDELSRVTASTIPGIPDRLIKAAHEILGANNTISELTLTEPIIAFPYTWRKVLQTLVKTGTEIVVKDIITARSKGDLAASRKGMFKPKGDGSIQLLRPITHGGAAHETAAWLSGLKDLSQTVIVGPDSALDEALYRFGLPTTGAGIPVYNNPLLQILPLVLEMAWDPPDPQRALELLILPLSPIPRGIAYRLIRALQNYPAVGSDDWDSALAKGLKALKDAARRNLLKQRLDTIFTATVKDEKYPVAEILSRIDVIRSWAKGRMRQADGNFNGNPLIAQLENAQQMVALSGLNTLTAPQVRRVIHDITQEGGSIPLYEGQAGLQHVGAAECLVGPAVNVVWWSFSRDAAQSVIPDPFSISERRALKEIGVILPDPGEQAIRNANRWQRPLALAKDHLIMVCSENDINGEGQYPHPLWDELTGRIKDIKGVSKLEKQLLSSTMKPVPKKRKPKSLPRPEPDWKANPSLIRKRPVESPNSFSSLFQCPFRWQVAYSGEISGGMTATLSSPEELEGWLIHEIMTRVLEKGNQTPHQAAKYARSVFDHEGPRLAAQFFLPGYDDLRAQVRKSAETAAEQVFRIIKNGGFTVESVEKDHELSVRSMGIKIKGRPDLVLDRPKAVIDFKRGGLNYRKTEIINGTSVQLTIYGHLLRGAENKPFPAAAYFMLKIGQTVTNAATIFPDAMVVEGISADETWKAIKHTYKSIQSEFKKGLIRAPGNADHPPERSEIVDKMLVLEPCSFCDFGVLCGKTLGGG